VKSARDTEGFKQATDEEARRGPYMVSVERVVRRFVTAGGWGRGGHVTITVDGAEWDGIVMSEPVTNWTSRESNPDLWIVRVEQEFDPAGVATRIVRSKYVYYEVIAHRAIREIPPAEAIRRIKDRNRSQDRRSET